MAQAGQAARTVALTLIDQAAIESLARLRAQCGSIMAAIEFALVEATRRIGDY